MVQNCAVLAQAAKQTRENFAAVPTLTSDAPCGYRPINVVSQVDRLNIEAAPGIRGHVCIVVGDDDGNGRQPPVFLAVFNSKRLPYF